MGHGNAHPTAPPRIDPRRTPFERTQAFRRFGVRLVPEAGEEHRYARALIVEQGFDGLPHVVSPQELDAYARAGEVELFRGVSAARYAQQLRSGELYVGQGTSGGGIYAAGGPDGRDHAAEYAQDPGSVLVRMTAKAGARIGDAQALTRRMLRERAEARLRAARGSMAALAVAAKTSDLSVYAIYLGYDGIVDHENAVWLMFNRTALRIQDTDVRP